MILILLTFFASLFAFVWAASYGALRRARAPSSSSLWASSRRGLDVDLRGLYRYLYQIDR